MLTYSGHVLTASDAPDEAVERRRGEGDSSGGSQLGVDNGGELVAGAQTQGVQVEGVMTQRVGKVGEGEEGAGGRVPNQAVAGGLRGDALANYLQK